MSMALTGAAAQSRRARVTLLGCICLGGLLSACGGQDETGGGQRRFGGGPVTVEAALARTATLADTIEALGTTTANESVTLTAKVTDTVGRVHFSDGEYAEQGKVLVELTNEEEQAQLAEAQANLRDAVNQRNRLKDLRAQNVVSASNLDEAEARVDGARARLNTIVARLKDRLIRAPFSGVLGFRQVSEGTLITPGTPITTLDDISIVKLDFTVPETALAELAKGQQIKARSAAYGEREFDGVVDSIGSRVDPITRAVVVRAMIDNPDRALRPGMLMTVRLVTRQREALVVPEGAVVQIGDVSHVFRIDDASKVKRQTITTGARRRGVIEVLDGLEEGDMVVSEGVIKVRDGSAVVLADAAGQG